MLPKNRDMSAGIPDEKNEPSVPLTSHCKKCTKNSFESWRFGLLRKRYRSDNMNLTETIPVTIPRTLPTNKNYKIKKNGGQK